MSVKVEDVLARLKVKTEGRIKSGWIWGLCPYHDDSHPSWRIRVTKDRYGQHVCYSCGNGGTLIDLVIHVLDFKPGPMEDEDDVKKRARTWLGEFQQLPDEEEIPSAIEVQVVAPALEFHMPNGVCFDPLEKWVSGARKYMVDRRVPAEQVERFGIGYAVFGRLEGRIVLTTRRRVRDKIVVSAYQARDFTGASEKRYLYPRESERANLDTIFGEHLWPLPSQRNVVVVTEGGFNAMAVERATRKPIGALGGKFIRPSHLMKLSTFRHVVILTDADRAGDEAAESLMTSLARHTRTTRVRLPEGADADEIPEAKLCEFLNAAF